MKNQNTKQTALANLTAEGFTAAITTSGLVVFGPGWKATFTDAGQDHDTFEGTVPSRVHDLATWDDETTRTRTTKMKTYKIIDSSRNLIGSGDTKDLAIADAAAALGVSEEQVSADIETSYQGEDSLFVEEVEA
jgi:hypothetical protein